MNHFSKKGLAFAAVVGGIGLGHVAALNAQSLDSLFSADERRIQLAQASQERIDKVVEDTRSLIDQYRGVVKELDGLEVYNTLLDRQIQNQNAEIADLSGSIDQVTLIERQIMPLMLDMIDGLEQFVRLDVPFLMDERTKRIGFLKSLLERSDVSVAEKFRRVLEAFQVENDYGRTIESYKGMLEIAGGQREVDFLRIGRVALLYQTEDGEIAGAWDPKSGDWVEVTGAGRNQIRQGVRMAKKQVAPDLLLLPVSAPEAVQ